MTSVEIRQSDSPRTGDLQGNILVVDDNPANLRLLSGMLTELGYKVRAVINGAMALRAAQAAPPDLVLLDISMPDMDGYEVCRRLKADGRTADIPVIFISAMDEIEDKMRAFDVGGVDYVAKPFQFQEVAARVATHLALNRLEQQLRAANEELTHNLVELQARNEELDAFAHTVAHDLKNPLTSLILYSSHLQVRWGQMPEEQVTSHLATITRSGQRMNAIIQELLLLSSVRKVEDVQVHRLDMDGIVAGAQERLARLVEEYDAEIVVPTTWPRVRGRSQWIEEIWANYISNAIKYGGQPPRVELGWTPDEPGEPGCIRFWVRDNGEGLTAEEQAALFAPFERLHQVRAEGHGLGLSIVKRIADKLGGRVGVTSEAGTGSTFWFTLPEG